MVVEDANINPTTSYGSSKLMFVFSLIEDIDTENVFAYAAAYGDRAATGTTTIDSALHVLTITKSEESCSQPELKRVLLSYEMSECRKNKNK